MQASLLRHGQSDPSIESCGQGTSLEKTLNPKTPEKLLQAEQLCILRADLSEKAMSSLRRCWQAATALDGEDGARFDLDRLEGSSDLWSPAEEPTVEQLPSLQTDCFSLEEQASCGLACRRRHV